MVSLLMILALSMLGRAQEQVVDVSLDSSFSKSDRLVGSIGGGTELFFKGTWGLVFLYNMEIMIGNEKCKIEDSYDRFSVVSCLTPPRPEEALNAYDITVFHKKQPVEFAENVQRVFYYEQLQTSVLYYASPPEFTPGLRVDLSGDWVSQNPIDIIEVRVQERLTDIDEDTPPIGDIQVTIGENTHWDGNVEVRFREGESRQHWIGLQTNSKGDLYNSRVLSRINSITRQGSSEAGGLPMAIRGQGFPTYKHKVEVDISGIPCEVLSVTYDRIEIITGAEFPKLKGPYYQGGAGLYQDAWFNQTNDLTVDELDGTVEPSFQDIIANPAPYETIPANSVGKYYGLFLAPYDGEYTFYAAATYKVDVLLGKDMSPIDPEPIITAAGGVEPRQYFVEPENQSKKIFLVGGQSYYIQMNIYTNSDNSHASVGVETPIGDGEGNRMPLVQKLQVSDDGTYTPPTGYQQKHLVQIYSSYSSPYGGKIRFRTDYYYGTTEYIDWDENEETWACADIEKAFELVKVYVTCKGWKEKNSIFYEFTVTDTNERYKTIEADTYNALPPRFVSSRSKSKVFELKYDPVAVSYRIVFKKEKSSEFNMSISAEDLQNMLNEEIEGFWGNLLVWSYTGKDGNNYFYFLLPGSMFIYGLDYIEIEYVATGYSFDPEILKVVKHPGYSKFWWVIPSDYLRTLEDKPQVRVSVSDSYAMCSKSCSFIYKPAKYIDSFSEDKKEGILILRSTEEFSLDISLAITVGEADCPIIWASKDMIKCKLNKGEAGKHQPVVVDDIQGFTPVSKQFRGQIVFDLAINKVTPDEGGNKGGTYLTLNGHGFPVDLERALKIASVKVGNSPCEILASSFTELSCVTSEQSTDSTIILRVNDVEAHSHKFMYRADKNLEIYSISPEYASATFLTEITIEGSNFGDIIEDISVFIGPTECYVIELEDHQILCKYLGGPRGLQDVVVYRSKIGEVWKDQYPVILKVTSVEPIDGSIYGGMQLTITGEGFFPEGLTVHRVLIGVNTECEITEIPDQETIICVAPPLPEELVADTTYEVRVIARLQEIADCEADCSFTWSTYRSPQVDSISPVEGVAGTTVTLTGRYFGDFDGHATLTFGGQEAEIVSVSDFTIVAIVPPVSGSSPEIALSLADRGNAIAEVTFFNKILVLNVEPKAVSQAGANITVSGAGFFPQSRITFGNVVCSLTALQNSFFQCDLPAGTIPGILPLSFSSEEQTFNCQDNAVCAVQYLQSATPQITSVSEGLTLQIAGNFLADISEVGGEVTLGDSSCTILTSSATDIECSPVAEPGSYPLSVYVEGFGFAVGDFNVTVVMSVDPVGLYTSSFAGGRSIVLTGVGFTADSSYTVCGREAEVVSATGNRTEILTPAMATLFSQLEYEVIFNEELVTDFTVISNNPATSRLAFDRNTTTFYTDPTPNKWIGVDVGEGLLVQVDRINIVPGGVGGRSFRDLSGSEVQASNDGINWDTLLVFDHVDDRQNEFKAGTDTNVIYRFFRVFKAAAEATWAINEFELYGALMFDNNEQVFRCPIRVAASDDSVILPNAVEYSVAYTPELTNINPTRGSALGEETVTFTGSGFGSVLEDISISIDGFICTPVSVSDTMIECVTEPKTIFSESILEIWVRGKGFVATRGLVYLYSELWSDPRTWGGMALPKEGETVYIAPGQVVILDMSPPVLEVLAIEGVLIVEDIPGIKIEADIVLVHFGRLEAGTEEKPFTNELEIKLNGGIDTAIATVFGNKMILVVSGSIDLHGVPRKPTWTFLGDSAKAGSSYIEVEEDVDWKPGEYIAIAPSGYFYYEAEKRKITDVQGRKIFLDKALDYDHYSAIETYGNEEIDMRTEVGLLTRNIKIYPDELDLDRFYGTHMFISVGGPQVNGRIAYTEIFRGGQAFRRLKYPVHYHIAGLLTNSYFRGNSFQNCYNRAITVHGSIYSIVEDNVAYDIMGHTYFIEDGNEFKNVFRNNLGIYTKPSNLLNTDRTPATFWIANPDNFYYNNHAAGSQYYGFWYDAPVNPPVFGFGDAPEILCTQFSEIGAFSGNKAHSNGFDGLKIEPRQIPVTDPCETAFNRTFKEWWSVNPALTANFIDFTAYKNGGSGIEAHDIGDIRFLNVKVADNLESGIQIGWTEFSEPFNSVRISGALVVGKTKFSNGDFNGYVGIKTPQTDGMLIENVRFHNIGDNMYPLGDSLFADIPRVADYGARVHKLSGLEFYNSRREIKWNTPFRGIYEILDDSFTGNAGDFVAAPWEHLCVSECRYEKLYASIVCKGASVRRVHFYNLSPLTSFLHQPIKVRVFTEEKSEITDYSELPMITTDQKKDIKYSWAVPLVTGHSYDIHWGSHPIDWETLNLEIDTFEGDESVRLVFNVTDTRGSYSARRGPPAPANINPDPTILTEVDRQVTSTDTAGTYSWEPGMFEMIVGGTPANDFQFNDIEITASRCPADGCSNLSVIPVTTMTVTRNWSDETSWPDGKKPEDSDSVIINPGETVILDESTPILKYLEVNGELIFDEYSDVTLNSHIVFIRAGAIRSGSATKPTTKMHSIKLHGGPSSEDLELNNDIDIGNQALVNTGTLEMYGYPQESWTVLEQNAKPGDNYIFVPKINWEKDQYIVIAPSGFDKSESEVVMIVDISMSSDDIYLWNQKQTERSMGKGGVLDDSIVTDTSQVDSSDMVKLTLDRPLKYYHSGTDLLVKDSSIDMRTEVGLLQRNVEIWGAETNWECSILTTSFTDSRVTGSPVRRSGRTTLDNVDIEYCGQIDSEKAALRFEANAMGSSNVTNSVITHSAGSGLFINGASNIIFSNNVLYQMNWRSVVILSTQNTQIRNNLAIDTLDRMKTSASNDKNVAFYGCIQSRSCGNTVIAQNHAIGYAFAGYIFSENFCGLPRLLEDNMARSGYVGFILSSPTGICVSVANFTALFNEVGVTAITPVRQLLFSGITSVENKLGLSIRTGTTPDPVIPYFFAQNVTNSQFIGKTHHSYCDVIDCESDDCAQRIGFYTGFADFDEITVEYEEGIEVPLTRQRDATYAAGTAFFEGAIVANYRPGVECKTQQHVIQSNPLVPDFSFPHFLSEFQKVKIDEDSLIFLHDPDPELVLPDRCGNSVCTGLRNVFIEDRDGSFIGEKYPDEPEKIGGVILPNNPGIASKDLCKFFEKNNAYICHYEPKQKDFYEIYVYEETLGTAINSAPVTISSNGPGFKTFGADIYSNELNTFSSQRFEGESPVFSNLRRFSAIVYTGLFYNISFTGNQAIFGRCYLQGTLGRNISISMTHNLQDSRLYGIVIDNEFVEDISALEGRNRDPMLADGHATTRYYYDDYKMSVILREETLTGLQVLGDQRTDIILDYFVSDLSQNTLNYPYDDVIGVLINIETYQIREPVADIFVPPPPPPDEIIDETNAIPGADLDGIDDEGDDAGGDDAGGGGDAPDGVGGGPPAL